MDVILLHRTRDAARVGKVADGRATFGPVIWRCRTSSLPTTRRHHRVLDPTGASSAISPWPILGEQQGHAAYIESQLGKIPLGRLGTPDDIARLTAFLASDEGGFVNGAAST